ncbi:MAG: cardiolipin synthase [Peptococcaceae bacterium]
MGIFHLNNIIPFSPAMEFVTTIFSLTIVFIGIVIFFENDDPTKTLAWLLILIFLPIIGFLLYGFFGRKFRKIKRFKRKSLVNLAELAKITRDESKLIVSGQKYINNYIPHKKKLINLITNSASAPFTLNNKTRVFNNGPQTFQSFFSAIEKARHHIHLEFYIFRDDKIGSQLKDLLIQKARAGIKIRLIYDGYGSLKLAKNFLAELEQNGIQTVCFSPVILPIINNRINYRNHRKILIVDGKIGFVGGINIGDEYLGKSKDFTDWRDTHLRIDGDAVKFLQHIFIQDWFFTTKEKITEDLYYPCCPENIGEELIQIAASGPDSPWEPIMQMYFSMIATAENSIYLTTPYFIPNESIFMAIKNAALSGLDVRIIIPGKPDSRFVLWASMSYLKELLEAGVRVYQYQKGFIHSKTLVVDGLVSSIGTANMDLRSFKLNFEVNAFVYNSNVARLLEEDFFTDLQNSKEISYFDYQKRSLALRFMESTARLFSPLL